MKKKMKETDSQRSFKFWTLLEEEVSLVISSSGVAPIFHLVSSPARILPFRMDFRVLSLIVLLSINWFGDAAKLETNVFIPSHSHIVSALHGYDQLPLPIGRLQKTQEVVRSEQVCSMCEDLADQAVSYLADNKTQEEIIHVFHKSCSKMHNFKKQCVTLVDYYAPLLFSEILSIQPEELCAKVSLCEKVVSISQSLSKNSCELCHNVVTEAIVKLKDPDTQLEIIEVLLKACDSIEGYVKKCKRLVFEYAPLIVINAETFLEKQDICFMLHACNSTTVASSLHPAS